MIVGIHAPTNFVSGSGVLVMLPEEGDELLGREIVKIAGTTIPLLLAHLERDSLHTTPAEPERKVQGQHLDFRFDSTLIACRSVTPSLVAVDGQ
jgi:hypothetical protein